MHKEAGAEAPKHSQNVHRVGRADAAVIIAQRDIQPLMKSVLNPPSQPVAVQPLARAQLGGFEVGDQADHLVLSALGLAAELGGLGGERKTDVFGLDRTGLDGPGFPPTLVPFDRASLPSGGFQRGKNPPGERGSSFQCSLVEWAGCL